MPCHPLWIRATLENHLFEFFSSSFSSSFVWFYSVFPKKIIINYTVAELNEHGKNTNFNTIPIFTVVHLVDLLQIYSKYQNYCCCCLFVSSTHLRSSSSLLISFFIIHTVRMRYWKLKHIMSNIIWMFCMEHFEWEWTMTLFDLKYNAIKMTFVLVVHVIHGVLAYKDCAPD